MDPPARVRVPRFMSRILITSRTLLTLSCVKKKPARKQYDSPIELLSDLEVDAEVDL